MNLVTQHRERILTLNVSSLDYPNAFCDVFSNAHAHTGNVEGKDMKELKIVVNFPCTELSPNVTKEQRSGHKWHMCACFRGSFLHFCVSTFLSMPAAFFSSPPPPLTGCTFFLEAEQSALPYDNKYLALSSVVKFPLWQLLSACFFFSYGFPFFLPHLCPSTLSSSLNFPILHYLLSTAPFLTLYRKLLQSISSFISQIFLRIYSITYCFSNKIAFLFHNKIQTNSLHVSVSYCS